MKLRNIKLALCLTFLHLSHASEYLDRNGQQLPAAPSFPLEYSWIDPDYEIDHLNSHEPSEPYPDSLLTEMGEKLISLSFLTDEQLQTLSEEAVTKIGLDGIKLLKRASNNGYMPATRALGMCYIFGHFIDRDLIGGEKCLQTAADHGDCIAQYELALLHIRGDLLYSDPHKARDYLELAADQGHSEALFSLGALHEQIYSNIPKDIVPQSFAAAVQFYELAADKGSARAQLALGNCYLDDRGVEKNEVQGIKFLTRAAYNGLPYAYTLLSKRYEEGEGIPRDPEKSLKYIKLASELGDPSAQTMLGFFLLGELQPSKKDIDKAHKLLRDAAKNGGIVAQEALELLNVPLSLANSQTVPVISLVSTDIL